MDTALAAPASMRRFVTMNPFHHDPALRLPVPGLPADVRACSVESVWQALKIVDGATDLGMLTGPPSKRPPESERGPGYDYGATTFSYGGRPIGLVAARYLIYLPVYLYALEHVVPEEVTREIGDALSAGRDVVFYDWDSNLDIEDTRDSFSHSAVLAAWFGGRMENEFVARRARWLGADEAARAPLPLDRYHRFHQH
ncbi:MULTISPECIES: DUF6939 family protein [Streptomyces]|nr:hypothetical protein [Streptomyces canarius]